MNLAPTAQHAAALQSAKFQRQQLSTKVQASTQPTTVQGRAQVASRAALLQIVQAVLPTQTLHRVLHRRTRLHLPTAVVDLIHTVADQVTRTALAATLTKAPVDNACRNPTGKPSFSYRIWRNYRLY
jgi:hypothetical protein